MGIDYFLADMDSMEEIELGRGFNLEVKEDIDEEFIDKLKKLVLHIRRVSQELGYNRETIYEEMLEFITEPERKGHKFQLVSDCHPKQDKIKVLEEK